MEHVATAATLADALDILDKRYFNVALVDLSLHDGDAKDTRACNSCDSWMHETLRTRFAALFSAPTGPTKRVRAVFHDYRVVDFLEKGEFSPKELVKAIEQALEANHLDRDLDIQLSNGHDMDQLWERFAWAKREGSLPTGGRRCTISCDACFRALIACSSATCRPVKVAPGCSRWSHAMLRVQVRLRS